MTFLKFRSTATLAPPCRNEEASPSDKRAALENET